MSVASLRKPVRVSDKIISEDSTTVMAGSSIAAAQQGQTQEFQEDHDIARQEAAQVSFINPEDKFDGRADIARPTLR